MVWEHFYGMTKQRYGEGFPETTSSITSFEIESDVVSLNGREPLQTDVEIGEDDKLHDVVRRSTTNSMVSGSFNKSHLHTMTPRASNLTGVEIYSVNIEPLFLQQVQVLEVLECFMVLQVSEKSKK